MTVKRMDNVGIVVENIDAAIEFFTELGLVLEGRAPIEGAWADGVTGLRGVLAWCLIAPAIAAVLYGISLPLLKRLGTRPPPSGH